MEEGLLGGSPTYLRSSLKSMEEVGSFKCCPRLNNLILEFCRVSSKQIAGCRGTASKCEHKLGALSDISGFQINSCGRWVHLEVCTANGLLNVAV